MAGILLLAFGLRVALAAHYQGLGAPPDAGAQPDQLDYELLAARLAAGEGYCLKPGQPTAFRTPGTPLTLLPAYLAFGHDYAAGRLWFAALSALTCLFVGLLGRAAFGPLAGLLAAGWLALYPGHFYYSMHFLSETPFSFWLALSGLGAVWAANAAGRLGRSAAALLCGLALGMATLTRPQALFAVPLAWALAPLLARGLARVAWERLLVGTAGFALALAPWVLRNQLVLGHLSMSSVGGCTFWGAHNERVLSEPAVAGRWIPVTDLVDAAHPLEGDEFEKDAQCWSYGKAFVEAHPDVMPGLIGRKLAHFVDPVSDAPQSVARLAFTASWCATIPFLLAGLWLAWRRHRVAALATLLPLAATFVTVVLFYGSQRFRDGIASTFAAPVGLAAAGLVARLRARAR